MEELRKLLKTAKKYVKKPIPVKAVKMEKDFEVETLEGIMKGKVGDYLVEGIRGELYVCKGEIFEESYECIDDFKKNFIFLKDDDKSILNLPFIANYFLRIGDDDNYSFYIEVSVNGEVHKMNFYYQDKKSMVKDKEFLKTVISLYRNRKEEK